MFLSDLYMTVNIDCFQLFAQFTMFNCLLQLEGLFLSFTKVKPFSSEMLSSALLCLFSVYCSSFVYGCNSSDLDLQTISAVLSALFPRDQNILSFKEQFLIKWWKSAKFCAVAHAVSKEVYPLSHSKVAAMNCLNHKHVHTCNDLYKGRYCSLLK